AGRRRGRCARDRAHPIAGARNGAARDCRGNTNMNRAQNKTFEWRWLGQVNFADALKMQEEIVARKRDDRLAADQLLMLEHEPVYTIGRTPDQTSLLDPKLLPYPLFTINRGGQ